MYCSGRLCANFANNRAVRIMSVLQLIESCRPVLRDAHDAVAFAIHSVLLQRGCRCVGLKENEEEKGVHCVCFAVGQSASLD